MSYVAYTTRVTAKVNILKAGHTGLRARHSWAKREILVDLMTVDWIIGEADPSIRVYGFTVTKNGTSNKVRQDVIVSLMEHGSVRDVLYAIARQVMGEYKVAE